MCSPWNVRLGCAFSHSGRFALFLGILLCNICGSSNVLAGDRYRYGNDRARANQREGVGTQVNTEHVDTQVNTEHVGTQEITEVNIGSQTIQYIQSAPEREHVDVLFPIFQ